jgi:hypothetical protein
MIHENIIPVQKFLNSCDHVGTHFKPAPHINLTAGDFMVQILKLRFKNIISKNDFDGIHKHGREREGRNKMGW